jgi:hypothetical protein
MAGVQGDSQGTICLKLLGSFGFPSHETASDALGKYGSAEELTLIRILGTGEQAYNCPVLD